MITAALHKIKTALKCERRKPNNNEVEKNAQEFGAMGNYGQFQPWRPANEFPQDANELDKFFFTTNFTTTQLKTNLKILVKYLSAKIDHIQKQIIEAAKRNEHGLINKETTAELHTLLKLSRKLSGIKDELEVIADNENYFNLDNTLKKLEPCHQELIGAPKLPSPFTLLSNCYSKPIQEIINGISKINPRNAKEIQSAKTKLSLMIKENKVSMKAENFLNQYYTLLEKESIGKREQPLYV